MRRALLLAVALGLVAAGAARADDDAGVVRINALRNPEVRTYRALAAGMDAFDAGHALAPNVPVLRFQLRNMDGGRLADGPANVKLRADDWSEALPLDAGARFTVPRSQAAWDARADVFLDRRERQATIAADVRTPGLPDNQRRLGDLRLACQVQVAMGKEQLGFLWSATLSGMLLTTDWCAWFTGQHGKQQRAWWVGTGADGVLASATLREGGRSMALRTTRQGYSVPIGDTSWSIDAIVDLVFADAGESEASTRTAGETPRTAP